jgi:hypothetical protein
MPQPFSVKFGFLLKALSMSRSQLAAELGVDKSIVGRWVTGAVNPSAHNLSRLTVLTAARVPGFTALDWERDLDSLADLLGVDSNALPGARGRRFGEGLPIPMLDQILETTARRGTAYEGFFRSTRPYAQNPGRFLHDQLMIRQNENGFLRFDMAAGGVFVEGWVLPLQNQLSVVGAELTSGALVFGIFNGVNTVQAGMIDGLILNCALDAGRTPTATAVIFQRIGDLSGDPATDDLRFADLAQSDALAPQGSVPEEIRNHLARDFGPAQLALGGEWLLRLPLSRSMSRGLDIA